MSDTTPTPGPHEPDEEGRWSAVSDRWNEVGERFQALGAQLRQQWSETKDDEQLRENQRSIDAALSQIADAAGRVVQGITDSVKDSDARQEATRAASSLADAFADTVQAAVDEVRRRVPGRDRPADA